MTTSLALMLAEARSEVGQLTVSAAADAVEAGALVLDVREPEEWAAGHVPGAVNIPRGWLEIRADPASPAADATLVSRRDQAVLVYCLRAPGARSLLAAATLRRLGYSQAAAVSGGLEEWSRSGLPVERPDTTNSTAPGEES